MGNFGSFGTTIAFSLLIIFFGYKRGRLFRCFCFAAQQVGDHQRGRNRLKHRGWAAEKLQNRSRGFALIAGWWLKGKRRNVYLAAVHFRHRRLERTWSPTLKMDQIKLQAM